MATHEYRTPSGVVAGGLCEVAFSDLPRSVAIPLAVGGWTNAMSFLPTALRTPAPVRAWAARSAVGRHIALWSFVAAAGELAPRDARSLVDGAGAPGVLAMARALGKAFDVAALHPAARVVLVNGERDRIAPVADVRSSPGRADRVEVLGGVGHLAMLEAPARLLTILRDELARPA